MEMFIDSSEWVMVPNVYGMGTFADGGTFATKPYICGSSYMLRMSNFKKGDCEIVDGLYWNFIEKNRDFFVSNPRLGLMIRSLDKMSKDRKDSIYHSAKNLLRSILMFRPEDKAMQITYSVGMLFVISLSIIGFIFLIFLVFS